MNELYSAINYAHEQAKLKSEINGQKAYFKEIMNAAASILEHHSYQDISKEIEIYLLDPPALSMTPIDFEDKEFGQKPVYPRDIQFESAFRLAIGIVYIIKSKECEIDEKILLRLSDRYREFYYELTDQ